MTTPAAKRRRKALLMKQTLTADALRHQAEQQVFRSQLKRGKTPAPSDAQRMVHELQVHKIELQMQNAELLESRARTESLLEKYTDLYDFSPVGYVSLAADGRIEMINLTGAWLLGQPRAKLTGHLLGAQLPAAEQPGFRTFLTQIFSATGKLMCEVTLATAIRTEQTVHLEAQHIAGEQSCRIIMRDVTERKQATEKLRVSEIRYRRIFEAAYDGVLLLDPNTRKITDANPFMTALLGYTHDKLIGLELYEIGLLKDESASQEMFRQLKRNHEVRYDNLPLKSVNGRPKEVEVVANLYQENEQPVIQCNIRDITERKAAEAVQQRLATLAAAHRAAHREIASRRKVELSLRKSQRTQQALLTESRLLHVHLRELTRQIITAQEEERKKISRELHDDVMQTLVGINAALGALGKRTMLDPKILRRDLAETQQLVKTSLLAVHRFARELRPTVLDDFGLIPALEAYSKDLAAHKKFRIHLATPQDLPALKSEKQTVLFRVAQEALANVARHARATLVELRITEIPDAVRIEIHDNGKSFQVRSTLAPGKNKRLGLLGMKERVEMVGGQLSIRSSPGRGTLVRVEVPLDLKETK